MAPVPPEYESWAKGMIRNFMKENEALIAKPTFWSNVQGFYHAIRWSEVGSQRGRRREINAGNSEVRKVQGRTMLRPSNAMYARTAAMDRGHSDAARRGTSHGGADPADTQPSDRAAAVDLRHGVPGPVHQPFRRAALAGPGLHPELL